MARLCSIDKSLRKTLRQNATFPERLEAIDDENIACMYYNWRDDAGKCSMLLSCPNAVESQNGMNDWRRLEHESKMLDKGKGVPHIAKPEESFASGVDIRLGSIQSDGLTPGIGTPLLKDDHRCRWSKRLVWYTALMALAAGLS